MPVNKLTRAIQLQRMRCYLTYLAENAKYLARKKSAEIALEDYRNNHVIRAVQQFDDMERRREEDCNWSWSPLFQILCREHLQGMPLRPWQHDETEWEKIIQVLQAEFDSDSMSLELQCPHIVRALKLYTRGSNGRNWSLAHPITGMTREHVLTIAKHDSESRRLSTCAQDIVDIGWALFPCIDPELCEPLRNCWNDVVALLGFEGWDPEPVLAKIENFLSRIARRALLDMHRSGRYKGELAAMWWTPGPADPCALRKHCNEVSVIYPHVVSINVFDIHNALDSLV